MCHSNLKKRLFSHKRNVIRAMKKLNPRYMYDNHTICNMSRHCAKSSLDLYSPKFFRCYQNIKTVKKQQKDCFNVKEQMRQDGKVASYSLFCEKRTGRVHY